MRILITNDDGINAPGLEVLTGIAEDIAGPGGEVWCVAPAFEQSGVGHCISYVHPTLLAKLGERRYAAEGTPADCVIAGLDVVMDTRPDLILSGVNRGNNAAENTLYSGTLGAALEGALQGVRSIALSQYLGPGNRGGHEFEAAKAHGADVVRRLLDRGVWNDSGYRIFYNVNFPPVLAQEVKGVQVTRQGLRTDTRFSASPQEAPTGRTFVWLHGGPQHVGTGAGTDAQAALDGYVAVTPLIADLTAHHALDELRARFE